MATIYLACPLPNKASGQPGYGPEPYIPLLGLAPNGVYLDQGCLHPCGGLLPHHFTLTDMQRYISVALSVGSPRPAVSGHSSGRARTFLRSCRIITTGGRPSTLADINSSILAMKRRGGISKLELYNPVLNGYATDEFVQESLLLSKVFLRPIL